jgi:hypothetical protein
MYIMKTLPIQIIEGEVNLVIDYEAGKSEALHVLQSAMQLIEKTIVLLKIHNVVIPPKNIDLF